MTSYKAPVENGEQRYLDARIASAEESGLPVDIDNLTAYSMMTDKTLDYYDHNQGELRVPCRRERRRRGLRYDQQQLRLGQ